jgi:hypothetical protein
LFVYTVLQLVDSNIAGHISLLVPEKCWYVNCHQHLLLLLNTMFVFGWYFTYFHHSMRGAWLQYTKDVQLWNVHYIYVGWIIKLESIRMTYNTILALLMIFSIVFVWVSFLSSFNVDDKTLLNPKSSHNIKSFRSRI